MKEHKELRNYDKVPDSGFSFSSPNLALELPRSVAYGRQSH